MDKELLKRARAFAKPYRVTRGKDFKLKDFDPGDTGGLTDEDKPAAQAALVEGVKTLAAQQDRLYAQDRWAVLAVFQAMDAAGKDGAIKHVMSGVNPQGCEVYSFKAPTSHDLDHDFLWRTHMRIPERGRIGIFNRSYYEDVLVVKVHPELLEKAKLPPALVGKQIWEERYEDIRNHELYLARNGVAFCKFFLHVSRKEQKQRFLARLEDPAKNWKFSAADARERGFWKDYMHAYEDMIRETATEWAPWYVVPADNKWYSRVVVAAALIDTLARLDLHYPTIDDAQRAELEKARAALLAEKD
jgi:PPK2 family polyphosphate:nucleotide phosphotransferase